MSNCQVSHSRLSGVHVMYGLITIDGNATTIHHNGRGGLDAAFSHTKAASCGSSIHLVAPFTLESITNNGGGGNFRGHGTIAIVDNEGTIVETIQEATENDY